MLVGTALARLLLLALFIAIGGCGLSLGARERFEETTRPVRQDCASVHVVRPLDGGSYAVLQVLGAANLRPTGHPPDNGELTEYLNSYATPPSGGGVFYCATIFGLLSPFEFSTVQSARDAIRSQTVSCCAPDIHWLIPTRPTEILGQASKYALATDEGAFSRPWYVVRRRHAGEVDVLSCSTSAALLKAVIPVLPDSDDSRLPHSVRTLSRTGSRAADAGSYVLRLDRAGLIHVLRIQATLFREVYLEADDRNRSFDTSESVDLVVVGTVFNESFDDLAKAVTAIDRDNLTPKEQVGVWPVPPKPSRAFVVYDHPPTAAAE